MTPLDRIILLVGIVTAIFFLIGLYQLGANGEFSGLDLVRGLP